MLWNIDVQNNIRQFMILLQTIVAIQLPKRSIAKLVKEIPNISLKTVYRNLYKLVDEGKIARISLANQKNRFDGDTTKPLSFML